MTSLSTQPYLVILFLLNVITVSLYAIASIHKRDLIDHSEADSFAGDYLGCLEVFWFGSDREAVHHTVIDSMVERSS